MVDAGTICSVVCLLTTLTLCGGLIGFGQDIFPTCSSRIDLQIEIQIMMLAGVLISAVLASAKLTGRNVKTSAQLEGVILVCAGLSAFWIAVETLIQFMMLIGFNNHCEIQMTKLGMVLLWLYVVVGSIFSLPILMYSLIILFAVGPLVYFEYKRNKKYRYHKNRAERMLGTEEGWDSFQALRTPDFMYRSYSTTIHYCIYYCSWEITFDEAIRCVSLGMRCPGCDEFYSTEDYVFISPSSFDHAHADCIEANIELLKHDENPHNLDFWSSLVSKMNEKYPREYNPGSVERFFEPEGLFRSVINPPVAVGGEDQPDPEHAPPVLVPIEEDLHNLDHGD